MVTNNNYNWINCIVAHELKLILLTATQLYNKTCYLLLMSRSLPQGFHLMAPWCFHSCKVCWFCCLINNHWNWITNTFCNLEFHKWILSMYAMSILIIEWIYIPNLINFLSNLYHSCRTNTLWYFHFYRLHVIEGEWLPLILSLGTCVCRFLPIVISPFL